MCYGISYASYCAILKNITQVRVYDSVLVEELNYKAILISEETTVEDVIRSAQHFPIYGHLGVRLHHILRTFSIQNYQYRTDFRFLFG